MPADSVALVALAFLTTRVELSPNAIGSTTKSFLRTLVAALSISAAGVAGAPLAGAAELGFLGGLFGGGDGPPPGPPPEYAAPSPLAGAYVPVSPPGMITYPGYNATYTNTACRGAYWGAQTDIQCGRTVGRLLATAIYVPAVVLRRHPLRSPYLDRQNSPRSPRRSMPRQFAAPL